MILYKYISSNGFDNIIKSGILWFSKIENANDKRERYLELSNELDVSSENYFCMCRDFRNVAMWYHYANHYDGACMEIDIKDDAVFNFIDIIYLNANIANDKKRLMDSNIPPRDYLSRKSYEWRYEDEIRVFCNTSIKPKLFQIAGNERGLLNIDRYIQNVYLGDCFCYENMSESTAAFLYSKYNNSQLKVLPKKYGFISNALDCNSPKLIELFNRYWLINS